MWGKNITDKAHMIDSLKVKQDFRFCIYSYSGNHTFHDDAYSNNHLMAVNKEVSNTILAMRPGDQVELKGKLVNVTGNRIDEAKSSFERNSMQWRTSTIRTDTGAGSYNFV